MKQQVRLWLNERQIRQIERYKDMRNITFSEAAQGLIDSGDMFWNLPEVGATPGKEFTKRH
jgi:hypothetical protein